MKHNFKVGDKVKCDLKHQTDTSYKSDYGGAAYEKGYEFTIGKICPKNSDVLWPLDNFGKIRNIGVFYHAVELINQEPNYEIY